MMVNHKRVYRLYCEEGYIQGRNGSSVESALRIGRTVRKRQELMRVGTWISRDRESSRIVLLSSPSMVLSGMSVNAFRSHSSLDNLTPRKFAEQHAKSDGNHSRFFLSAVGAENG